MSEELMCIELELKDGRKATVRWVNGPPYLTVQYKGERKSQKKCYYVVYVKRQAPHKEEYSLNSLTLEGSHPLLWYAAECKKSGETILLNWQEISQEELENYRYANRSSKADS